MENLRQQKAAEEGSDEEDLDRAAEAVEEVEHAMETLQSYDRNQRAAQVANAALARERRRQQASMSEGDWRIVTPNEVDQDELLECIRSSKATLKDAAKLSKVLAKGNLAHNWRELANHVPATLHAQVLEKEASASYLTEEQIADWVDYARVQSLEEIMVEVCDGNVKHVQLLRDNSPTNTPKDLAAWIAMPDLLLEELGDGVAAAQLTVEDLSRYCSHASHALTQVELEWMNWYVTSIE